MSHPAPGARDRGEPSGPEVTVPKVSVCVATYRRAGSLTRLLGHLAELEPPAGGFEVVVVDDGSPAGDGVAEALAARAGSFPVPLRWWSLPANTGRAAARNTAWSRAEGEWIAFTDDDCRPDRKWLLHLLEVAETSTDRPDQPAVVQGRVVPDPERSHLLAHPLARSLRVEALSGYYETANILYRREALEQLGGFDESFPGAGEDTELGWRVREGGGGALFAPDAVVVHDVVVRSFREDLRDRRRWGDVVRVVKLHPATRRLAWRPLVFRRSHVGPLAALAALPVAAVGRRSRRALAVAVLVGTAKRAARARTAEGARLEVLRLVGDCYEVGVLIRSSIRHRVVLL